MEIDHDGIGRLAQWTSIELAPDRAEGIVQRLHEDAAHGIDDERALAVLGVDQGDAAAGRMARKVQRTDQARRAFDEDQRLLLIPGVIAERDGVGTGVEEFLVDRLRDAKAAGRILAIDDDEIERPVPDYAGKIFIDGGASGPADDVTDKEDTQAYLLRKSNTSFSVSTKSSATSCDKAGMAGVSWTAKASPIPVTAFDLRKVKAIAAIGTAFSVQQIKAVPALPHDVALDYVLTEKKVFDFRS